MVHRIAYLIRAKRERPDSILALTYNRHAAVEIRQRLVDLIGEDSRRVTVLTCHGLAMRLVGLSFTSKVDQPDDKMFAEILKYAIRLLKGEDLPPEDADDQRERLLAGFRWILVDEYQDINGEQYELISALAGRSKDEDSHKLTIFAVGDDDQNIYSFNGASVEFIRNFETDFGPKPKYLTANYRSTGHIIQAANLMIKPAKNRMKDEHPIRINKKRTKDALGGRWQQIDPVVRGRVQIIEVNGDSKLQSLAVITEFERLSNLDSNWNWSKCAVIARNWKFLDPVRAICEHKGIPYQMADEEIPNFWRLRETRQFVRTLKDKSSKLVDTKELRKIIAGVTSNTWKELLIQAVDEHELETGGKETPTEIFFDWLAEWGREIRKRQSGLLLLTGHRAKGLEFDHVAILDGGWDKIGKDEDVDAPRRLYYVAMTRARETLAVTRLKGQDNHLLDSLRVSSSIVKRTPAKLTNTISEFNRTWFRASLKHIDLSFAGRQNSNEPVHQAIANLSCGSELDVQFFENKWLLKSKSGMTVGKLSQHFRPPSKMKCHSAKVYALIERTKEMSEPEYLKNIRCESWEVVVPEMVFVPE